MLTVLALLGSAMLSSACVPRKLVLLDPTVPHRVAEEAVIVAWCRLPEGALVKCKVRLQEGWWVASPQLVE